MLDRIRRAQDALRLARGMLQVPLRWQRSTVHALVSDHPGERAPLCRDRILQKQQTLNEGFRPRRAPGRKGVAADGRLRRAAEAEVRAEANRT